MEKKTLAAYVLGILGGIAGVVHSGIVFYLARKMLNADTVLDPGSMPILLLQRNPSTLPITLFLLLLGLGALFFLQRFEKVVGMILVADGIALIAAFFLSLMNIFWGLAFLVSGILVLAVKKENASQNS